MLYGRNMVLRIPDSRDVALNHHHENDPRKCTKRDFDLGSITEIMSRWAQTSLFSENDALLAVDLPGKPGAGYVRWFLANPAMGNMEVEAGFYDEADDTVSNRADALGTACRYLFGDRPMRRIQLLLDPEDETGAGAAEAAGFRKEGTLRSMVFVRGLWRDLDLWSVLSDELVSTSPDGSTGDAARAGSGPAEEPKDA